MRKKSGKRSGLVKLFPPLVMLSKSIDVGRAKRAQPKHHGAGYSAPYKAAHRLFVPPCLISLHSPWQRAGVLLVVYSTAQRCSALFRNSSSEQERPVRSVVLIWSSSARVRPSAALRNLSRGSDRLRRPSRPKQHWNFDPAEKKLTSLPVLRYDSGHRKRRFKFTIRRYNHPIRIAERIATLDVLSNGRLNWGGRSGLRVRNGPAIRRHWRG